MKRDRNLPERVVSVRVVVDATGRHPLELVGPGHLQHGEIGHVQDVEGRVAEGQQAVESRGGREERDLARLV